LVLADLTQRPLKTRRERETKARTEESVVSTDDA
jgi:hypothetical protein